MNEARFQTKKLLKWHILYKVKDMSRDIMKVFEEEEEKGASA